MLKGKESGEGKGRGENILGVERKRREGGKDEMEDEMEYTRGRLGKV